MKRTSLAVLILGVCFVPMARGQQTACKFSPFWAEFHKQNMERWNRCEQVLNVGNVGSLSLKWTFTAGSAVESSPAVADGVVYFGSEYPDFSVYAVDTRTGAELWKYVTNGAVYSSPAVANGVVYVGSYDTSEVFALDARTGAKLWKLRHRQFCQFLTRCGERCGLRRLKRRQRVCFECPYGREAVELCHQRPSIFLSCRDQWSRLC